MSLYDLFQVPRNAPLQTITKSYHKLAKKLHPDKNKEDGAEAKYEEILTAYKLLSDPKEREVYNLRTFGEALNESIATPVKRASNNGGGFKPKSEDQPDPPGSHPVLVTLEEFLTGCTKKVTIGRVLHDAPGVLNNKEFKIQVKPGWKQGTKLTFPGEGDHKNANEEPDDAVFIIKNVPHKHFERDGADLHYTVQISHDQALRGSVIDVPTLEGDTIQLRLSLASLNSSRRFPDRGLPYPKMTNSRGDIVVHFETKD